MHNENQSLIFEISKEGRVGYSLEALDVPEVDLGDLLPANLVRAEAAELPEVSELDINGVFVFIGTVPNTDFLQGKVELDNQGYILTNEKMETNLPGVYAVGDARAKYLRQVVTAAADGAIAAVAAERYLEGHVEGRVTPEELSKLNK